MNDIFQVAHYVKIVDPFHFCCHNIKVMWQCYYDSMSTNFFSNKTLNISEQSSNIVKKCLGFLT